MPDPETTAELIGLEQALWEAQTRFDYEFMEHVLAEDFGEFGRSGRVYTRTDTLAVTGDTIDARLRDIEVDDVAEGVVLVTYVSEVQHEKLDLSNRTSLWVKRDGRWQLRFHQGTPTS
jgi:hypothetical protein